MQNLEHKVWLAVVLFSMGTDLIILLILNFDGMERISSRLSIIS